MKLRQALCACFVGYIILALAACSANTATPPHGSVQPKPTLTTIPQGTILYQADWSRGMSDWHASQGWTVVQGQLQGASLSDASIMLPYHPTVANYAIEVRVQIVRVLQNISNSFYIFANKMPGKDGYKAGVITLTQRTPQLPPPGFAQIAVNSIAVSAIPGQQFQQVDYVPGSSWHTYRVEVQGNQAVLLIDGSQVSSSTSTEEAISNGPIGLSTTGLELRVSSLSVVAL